MAKHEIVIEDGRWLIKGLKASEPAEVVLFAESYVLKVPCMPKARESVANDQFILESTDGEYSQTKRVSEAIQRGANFFKLEFTGLDPIKRYNLTIADSENGADEGMYIFHDRSFKDLKAEENADIDDNQCS